ncbi:MAG: helix-turn-helix domain-containing protein [Methylobacterium sp.]|uniref:helix-turn-helix domain-containing protein n=1 Tax=Methylobacterium sp. TaxID=409 RepID=UPI0027177AEA|nr:helix-turn-helix domain-containing protein [Methylobacterium sp.]MDO9426028.1 helix-turn-helix domain-containing protein [Methylobacterium sp.]
MLTQTQSFHRSHHSVGQSIDSHCLIPFDRREGMTTAEAAHQADRTERTIRMWCRDHDIGRRIAGGPWMVSRVALAMFLNDDACALRAYLAGDRRSSRVVAYFAAQGLEAVTFG